MSTDIVTVELPENIAREFEVNEKGVGFVSRRGIARLCGVSQPAIKKLIDKIQGDNQNLPKSLKWLSVYTFEGDNQKIVDTIASGIIKYYAYQGREVAQTTDQILGAVGLRTVIQKALNYQAIPVKRLTQEQIVELCILPVPTDWTRRFPEEYYNNLARLTGLEQFGTSRPPLWAKYTKELVYDWLPTGIYQGVKKCKKETDGYDKLHQFLSEDGLAILENHQRQLLTLMQASSSIEQLKSLLSQSCTGNYQMIMFCKSV